MAQAEEILNGPLPPGTILQHLYFKERFREWKSGRFIEVGVGQGHLSRILLKAGWHGLGYDLNPACVRNSMELNREFAAAGRYEVHQRHWLRSSAFPKVNMVISSHVLEHMNENDEKRFLQKAKATLKPGGRLVLLVPACMDYWGIDDENAGHYRRYSRLELEQKAKRAGFKVRHLSGLDYPLSNWLFPISQFLVSRYEGNVKGLSMDERTQMSGNKDEPFRTTYPAFLKFILNEIVLFPFHLIQKACSENEKCMVLYAELEKKA